MSEVALSVFGVREDGRVGGGFGDEEAGGYGGGCYGVTWRYSNLRAVILPKTIIKGTI